MRFRRACANWLKAKQDSSSRALHALKKQRNFNDITALT
jgi:hypothetical protein